MIAIAMGAQTCPHCLIRSAGHLEICPGCGERIGGGQSARRPSDNRGLVVVAVAVSGLVALLLFSGAYMMWMKSRDATTAEAKNSLGQLAMDAVTSYESEHMINVGPGDQVQRRLCPSATAPIPANVEAIRGKSYQAAPDEWAVDQKIDAGFACLRFEVPHPQRYQYSYEATETSFVGRAIGDLDGDGVTSTFEVHGHLVDGRLMIDPALVEIRPYE